MLLPGAAFAQDDDGGGFLERLLEDNLSGAGRDVQIVGFAGALSSEATIQRLTIADDEGVWLTLEDVVLDWRRTALLRGRLVVNRLTAASISLPRLPQAQAQEDEGIDLPQPEASGFSLPELPVSVNIGEISTPSISIGEPVFGIASEFSLDGSLSLQGGEGAADFEIVRTDGPAGIFDIEASYANETRVLDLALDFSEQQGGILATLAGIPGEPSVDLDVQGEGPLDAFEATLSLSTDDTERLVGTLNIGGAGTTEGGPVPFRAEVAGDIAPLLAPEYAEFFGESVALVLGGVRAPDGALDFRTFTLDARQISFDGQLSLAPGGLPRSFDLAGTIASDTGEPVLLPIPGEPTEVRAITMNATFDASSGDAWQGEFRILGLDRPGFSAEALDLDGDGTISRSGAFTANLNFAAEELDLGDPAAVAALGERVTGRVELSGAPDAPLDISRFDITGESYALEAAAVLDINDRDLAVDGRARLSAQDLSVFSGIAERPLAGSAELSVAGSGQILGGAFDATVEGRTTDLSIGIPELDNLVEGTTRLTVAARRSADGLTLETFRLGSPVAQITAEGAIRSVGTRLNLSASIDDGALVLPGLDGRHTLAVIAEGDGDVWQIRSSLRGATLSAAVDGELDDSAPLPAFDGLVTVDAGSLAPLATLLEMPGLSGAASLELDGQIQGDLSTFDLEITAEGTGLTTGMPVLDPLLDGRVALSLDAGRGAGPIEIRELAASTATISIEGEGTLSGLPEALVPFDAAALLTAPAAFDGRIAISATDLAPAAAISGLPDLGGGLVTTVSGQADFDLSSFDLDLSLESQDLSTGLPDIDAFLRGGVSATLEAARETGPIALDRLEVSARWIDAALEGVITGLPSALVPIDNEAILQTARFDGSAEISSEDLAPLGPIAGLPRLAGAVEIEMEGSVAANLETLDVQVVANGANLRTGLAAVDEYIGGGTVLSIDASRSESSFEIRRGRFASPALSAQVEGSIGPQSGDLNASVRLEDLGRIVEGFSGRASADLNAERSSGNPWQITSNVDGPGGMRARAEGTVSTGFDRVDLDITGSVPLGLANTFIAPQSLGGQASFDLSVSGPPALSSVSGTITTSDARLVAPTLGFVVQRMDGTVRLSGERAQVDVLASIEGGGRVTVSGPIGLAPPLDADLSINLANVRVTDPELYDTIVNGDISIDGPLAGGATIAGQLRVGRTEIRIPAGVSGGVVPIPDIVHVAESAAVRQTLARAGLLGGDESGGGNGGGGPAYPLDLRILAPNQIFIRGRGLDAELGGSFGIGGTTDDVIPVGQLELIRGRLDILGKRLVLDEGSITVQGDFNPFVRLVAVSQAEDVTVRIVVEGPISEPEISFLSEPALPEDEVVARLLFGRGIETLSPLQAAQLAAAVATLTGGGNGVLGNLRANFGLDDLNVSTDESGGLAVTAGRYISDNVYTDVTVNSEGETELKLNLDLTPSVKVTGQTSTSGESGIGVYYERDY